MRSFLILAAVVVACVGGDAAFAEAPVVRELPPGLQVPDAAKPQAGFDVDRATDAWLDLLSPEQRRLSDAYFEGGYWLHFWELLYGLGVFALLLVAGWSRKLRDVAERLGRRRFLAGMTYAALFVVVSFVLELPLSIYARFWREHQYGLSNLSFPGWMREALIALAVDVVIGSVVLALLLAGIRRAGARWWAWAIVPTFVTVLALDAIFPVFVAPLFNDYKPLPEGPTRSAVFALARANEIPTDHVAWFDASKQTTRISANVSGVLGVTRLSLNDNLLEKTSLPEIKAVLGHEMGHYVLNHVYVLAVYQTLLIAIALWGVHIGLDRALARWGTRLGLRDRADPAALPLGLAIFSAIWFLLSPLQNTMIRTIEAEADAFGLNAAREPEGFAMAATRLSTYRKLKPGVLEEFLFYDHPSGYDRVRRAMLWRKENVPGTAPQ